MRPFPKGHKGLTLVANGKLEPAGEAYLDMVTAEGTSRQARRPPGDHRHQNREIDKIILMFNGGPDAKHRFLRHIQIGTGPTMNPVVQGDDPRTARVRA